MTIATLPIPQIMHTQEGEEGAGGKIPPLRTQCFRSSGAEDASFREKSDADLEKEYEELKRKVEKMENDVFDKEKEWDARFKDETK